jgi:hypothetical protein
MYDAGIFSLVFQILHPYMWCEFPYSMHTHPQTTPRAFNTASTPRNQPHATSPER